ncbi:hemerythrin domain-containing protein [Iamia majanohamensis]|uniref:Hemerythrin domain-containing protein n=1 Tax=Iamia majanohamensis TaxID=467976 RepID=A0AAE9Y7H5_9ACTN|nr:hemerythrin domain-containing protein [Iamia majanohamensis]WCO68130.1 hemerythrin domain-containing protein [Iamia majanohamensis]
MTTIDRPHTAPDGIDRSQLVSFDLYRDIHKGIRTELFATTVEAGRTDPADPAARAALADRVAGLAALLVSHAHHEDAAIDPVLEVHRPDLAEAVTTDHAVLDARLAAIVDRTRSAVDAPDDHRAQLHWAHLDLASFTSAYLAHQDLEERVVMPALDQAIGFEALLGLHQSIIGAIPPDELAESLALMLPAMNVEDRVEMLAGMRASAPPEVFAGVLGLAASVLAGPDHEVLVRRLEV